MELCSLHPFGQATVDRFVQAMTAASAPSTVASANLAWEDCLMAEVRRGYERALGGDETGANAVSLGLARLMATEHPTYVQGGMGFTILEARIDRGMGMLLRPPSRLFGEAGLPVAAARAMPIRLDLSRGLMGGAFVPARLVPDLEELLDTRSVRFLRRLAEAELDAVAVLGLLMEACVYARDRGLGLYEAMDVITPEAPEADPPGTRVRGGDRTRLNPELRRRLEADAKPPRAPGLVARLFGRGGPRPTVGSNGQPPRS